MSSLRARTRSECPLVRRSWVVRAVASTRIVSAARLTSPSSWLAGTFALASSRRRSDPARKANRAREGVWSGKASERRSRATRGSTRSSCRTATPTARTEAPRAPTHQRGTSNPPAGRGTSQLIRPAAPTPTTSGTATIATLTSNAARGRGSHRAPAPGRASAAGVVAFPPICTYCGKTLTDRSQQGHNIRTTARRLLVVDDSDDRRAVLQDGLMSEGFEVAEAPDARTAMTAIAHAPPDLVLLAVLLPDTGGFEFLRQLRRSSEVPVILLGAGSEEGARITGLDLGADDYVLEPFSTGELAARVRAVL